MPDEESAGKDAPVSATHAVSRTLNLGGDKQYEFSLEENRTFEALRVWALVACGGASACGALALVVCVLQATYSGFFVNQLFLAVTFAGLAVCLYKGAASADAIVKTSGSDISHLMNMLGQGVRFAWAFTLACLLNGAVLVYLVASNR